MQYQLNMQWYEKNRIGFKLLWFVKITDKKPKNIKKNKYEIA